MVLLLLLELLLLMELYILKHIQLLEWDKLLKTIEMADFMYAVKTMALEKIGIKLKTVGTQLQHLLVLQAGDLQDLSQH